MPTPIIKEVQPQIIEMDGIQYVLADAGRHQAFTGHLSGCHVCDGHAKAPADDPERLHVFDHYCFGNCWPLRCTPMGFTEGQPTMVYKKLPCPITK